MVIGMNSMPIPTSNSPRDYEGGRRRRQRVAPAFSPSILHHMSSAGATFARDVWNRFPRTAAWGSSPMVK
jgi:hypothetical protein